MKPIPTAAAREASVFALFAILAVAMTWPLAAHLGTAVPDPGDAYVSTYVMAWDYHATFSHTPLFSPPIFYPAKDALAFSEHLYGSALPLFPLYAMGVAPLTAYNIGLLLAFALSGYGAWVLARVAGASWIAAIAAGCFFAFVPYRFTQLGHISYVSAGWLALLFAAALAYLLSPTSTRAVLLGLAFFFNGLSCLHWFVLGATTLAFSIPMALIVIPASRRFRFWIPPLIAVGLATVALLPFLLPYREARELYQMERSLADLERYSAHLRDWLIGPLHLPYGGYVNNGTVDPERWLFPGLVPLLIVIALWWRRPFAIPFLALTYFRAVHVLPLRWDFATRAIDLSGSPWIPALIAIVFLLIPLPSGEGGAKRRVRGVPFAVTWLLLGLVCSLGVHSPLYRALFHFVSPFRGIRVPARWSMIVYLALAMLIAAALSRRHAIVAVLCTLAILAEQRAPIRYYYTVEETPEVYRWLKTAPIEGAVFELPYRRDGSEYRYMLRAATYLRPMINGVSSFEPPNVGEVETLDASLLAKLRARGASHIIVHTDRTDASQWLTENAASLKLVRRFCNDAVYAIDRNTAPAIESCDTPVAHLDSPLPNADIRGPLTIRGTIDRSDVQVRALFEGGSAVPIPIDGNTFSRTLPFPPESLHKYTDVQIEIVDGAGKRTRLDDQFLEWRPPTDLLFYDWLPGALHELAARMHRDDRFAYAIRDSTGQANVIARALLHDTKELDDMTFTREAFRAIIGRDGMASWPDRRRNRYGAIIKLISSDEFAAKHLLPTPR